MAENIPPEYADVKKTEIRWTAIIQIIRSVAMYGCAAFIGYCGWQSTEALAGEDTALKLVLDLLADVKVGIALNAAALGGLMLLWRRERKLRSDTIQRLGGRVKELELVKDPDRSTSHLDYRGNTMPEDRL